MPVSAHPDIARTFQAFYTDLYHLNSQSSQASQETKRGLIQQYLESSGMPSLSDDIATEFDHPITTDELLAAQKAMKPGKVPGPDGSYFSIMIYVSL